MESRSIYEESHEELVRIKKSISTDRVEIDISKLDAETKNVLLSTMNNIIFERCKAIEKVILGAQ